MWRRPACQTLSRALDISSATAPVALDLLKALTILSDATVRRSAVDWEDPKPEPLEAVYYWEKRPNIWPEIPFDLKFMKKTSMPKPVKSLGYIKCYSCGSPRPVKSPSNSIRYNCQKICSWLKRPKTILEIKKRAHFSRWSTFVLFTSW